MKNPWWRRLIQKFWILQLYKKLPTNVDVFLVISQSVSKTLFLRTFLNSCFLPLLIKTLTRYPNYLTLAVTLPLQICSFLYPVVSQIQHFFIGNLYHKVQNLHSIPAWATTSFNRPPILHATSNHLKAESISAWWLF